MEGIKHLILIILIILITLYYVFFILTLTLHIVTQKQKRPKMPVSTQIYVERLVKFINPTTS